jgi:gluconolactonase
VTGAVLSAADVGASVPSPNGTRLVEPSYEITSPAFNDCIDPVAWLERLHTGCRWAEGPVYFGDLRCLVWSDIPNQRMLRLDECSGGVSVFRAATGHANGSTRDREGRLVTCEQGARRVVRTEHDGSVTVLAERFEGRRFNAPNDVVVRSDGTIWFTDPSYGIISDYVGNKAPRESASCNVYRLDPRDRSLRVVVDDFSMPNGLAFSPDERTLYVADSGYLTDDTAPRHIRAFDVGADGTLAGGDVLATIEPGIPDGLRVDTDGRLWIGAGDGVHCVTADGEPIGKILVPEASANLTFGGPKRNRLYITATSSLYAVYLNVTGAQRP